MIITYKEEEIIAVEEMINEIIAEVNKLELGTDELINMREDLTNNRSMWLDVMFLGSGDVELHINVDYLKDCMSLIKGITLDLLPIIKMTIEMFARAEEKSEKIYDKWIDTKTITAEEFEVEEDKLQMA